MTGSFARGLAAGAAGSTALHAATSLDMALRGRGPSRTPERMVDALTDALGGEVPGRCSTGERRSALGALLGVGNGVTVGVLASLARSAGIRLPGPVGAVAAGAAAMALTDGSAAVLGVSDPRQWSGADRVADALPHLAYGAAVQAVLGAVPVAGDRPTRPAGVGLTMRSALLGVATGCRSTLGLAAPTVTGQGAGLLRRLASVTAVAGELVGDKSSAAPDRTAAPGLPARLASAAGGAGMLAAREHANAAVPIVAGVVGAAAGAWGGLGWRRWAGARVPDWQAALAEDGVALLLAAVATRRPRRAIPDRAPLRPV